MDAALNHGRLAVLGSLGAVIALAWAYLAAMASHGMGGAVASPAAWGAGYAAAMLVMWALMMVAMMLPSALPMVLIVDRFNRSGASAARAGRLTAAFVCGYVLVWAGFSAAATLLQWGLEASGLLTGSMALSSARLAALVYLAAGAYQFSGLKRACLDACRSPLAFLSVRWRPGPGAALRIGMAHGAFCLGCCWVLMGLLFVGGVMNLLWIVPLALFVLVEKCLPGGERVGKLAGLLLIGWGAGVLLTA
jgi:predicted metal-binding membrane protein